ncbi:MAG: hypothetical protein F6J90_40060 [Moorea sp. SIOASIH]|uniref:hypothetical protein n=1 Tax=Moorena sp. SIOASIH TaxID=2607817 RepID=UPI0013BC90BF|nr:hypothetical protein [Moorena sp. SIOASIH]NEO42188.1 hypothetical protein [Moorena sp. SIOASIH]
MQSASEGTTAVAHGAWVCVRNLRPHRCLPRGDHGKARVGETPFGRLPPFDRTASL